MTMGLFIVELVKAILTNAEITFINKLLKRKPQINRQPAKPLKI